MAKRAKVLTAVLALVLILGISSLYAVWVANGNPVCEADNDQWHVQNCPDGSNGSFIVWTDYRNDFGTMTNADIYARRIDGAGVALWAPDGVGICSYSANQDNPQVAVTASGDAIIVWDDYRNIAGDIYAQKVNALGAPQWNPNGNVVCGAAGDQQHPKLCYDSMGGAIVTWMHYNTTSAKNEIRAQKINSSGSTVWAEKVIYTSATQDGEWPEICEDRAGGAIITWYTEPDYNIYAQRIEWDGSIAWAANGILICNEDGAQFPRVCPTSDSYGGIITWYDERNGNQDIFAQRVESNGAISWGANGLAICTASNNQQNPRIVTDDSGGAVIAWEDNRTGSNYDIYIQRTSNTAGGTNEWATNGVAVCQAPGDQGGLEMATDQAGGAILTWHDSRSGNSDIYAQRINASGVPQWTTDGVVVCNASGFQDNPSICTDEAGGAIIPWTDGRNGPDDIYALRIDPDGYIYNPPACDVSPTILDFGSVDIGDYDDLTFTITNTGGGTLAGFVSESCDHYDIISGGGAYSLTAGQFVTVTVRFEPGSIGTKVCTVETGSALCDDVSCTGLGTIFDCDKEGDPGLYVDFGTDFETVSAGQVLGYTLGPANFGFVSALCTDRDTFCVYVEDTEGWTITGDPPLDQCTELDPTYLWWQGITITVPCGVDICDYDTVIVRMTYCDASLDCRHECTDCEDPNWYDGVPYYSADTLILHVSDVPPAIYILQDSLYYVSQGQSIAYVPFSICNGDPCGGSTAFDYHITCTPLLGAICSGFPQSGSTAPVTGGDCADVWAVVDAGTAVEGDMCELQIIAWDAATGAVYDTCVQLVQVCQPLPVPMFTTPVVTILVLALILAAGVIMRRKTAGGGRIMILIFVACMLSSLFGVSSAREIEKSGKQVMQNWSDDYFELPEDASANPRLFSSAQVDTYCIVYFDFEVLDWQGWTRFDNTAQRDTFFHVDDFNGLGGGSYGRLVSIEGAQSMWCGARPALDEYLCSWVNPPGYGNDWDQMLVSEPISARDSVLHFSYHGVFDTEDDWDFVHVEYDTGDSNWVPLASYEGVVDTTASHEIPMSALTYGATKLRFHFTADGDYSDQDGVLDTDGAAVVDEIALSDGIGSIDYEDFESASPGAKGAGIWQAVVAHGYGAYSGLTFNLDDKDPCNDNYASQVVFFIGSTYPSADYPGLYDTPFCLGAGGLSEPCQDDWIISPPIDLTKYSTNRDEHQDADIPPAVLPELGGTTLNFTVYRDLPVDNLVFYEWHVRNIDPAGCPGEWLSRNLSYYGDEQQYIFDSYDISDLVSEDIIQVALSCHDLCSVWYPYIGDCAHHTPSPWFDNVHVKRYTSVGPQWSYVPCHMFQDNFPEEYEIDSYVRADMAMDVNAQNQYGRIIPGDSIIVSCASPNGGGIAENAFGPMVFMLARVTYIGDPSSPKPVPAPHSTWAGDGTMYIGPSADYPSWEIFQGYGVGGNKYAFDMNDSLFTYGFMIEYFFEAEDNDGETSTLPKWAEYLCNVPHRYHGNSWVFEWTCLPTLYSDVLYVDDFHGIGSWDGAVQNYFDQTFQAVIPSDNIPDRYDVNGPTNMASNGIGSRARYNHAKMAYNKIIFDSGNLRTVTMSDPPNAAGTGGDGDKSDDVVFIHDWVEFSPHETGLWVLGDNVAQDLSNASSLSAKLFLHNWCKVNFIHDSYFQMTGSQIGTGTVSPLMRNYPTPPVGPWSAPDSLYAFGGCPLINDFDVLDIWGNSPHGHYAIEYPEYMALPYCSAIWADSINAEGYTYRTLWCGFSFMFIRDVTRHEPIVRNRMTKDVYSWFGGAHNSDISGIDEEPPIAYSLDQNFPNPFNPATSIRFGMKTRGRVRLRIYNAAGQLVRTLLDEERDVGFHTASWDGRNNHGSNAASGVYFYRMETGDYISTKKMVLLR